MMYVKCYPLRLHRVLLHTWGGGSSTEAHKMLKRAIGDNAMGITQTFYWFPRFRHGGP